jgi:murein DD-endopeptidase MepM/ murein hydrolase activator NlpD
MPYLPELLLRCLPFAKTRNTLALELNGTPAPETRRSIFLSGLLAAWFCLAPAAHADSYITRTLNKPVPGGVAVVDLGTSAAAPKAFIDGKPVLVVKEQDNWRAIVGLPLSYTPGTRQLTVQSATAKRQVPFSVVAKQYPEQRITLKNKRQVNPEPQDLTRINRELAIQTEAYRSFSPGTPSNLVLDKPVTGPLSSRFGVRRFFNGEERNPHAGLDFAVPAGTPIKTPAAGKVILIGDYFFNGNTVFVDHGQGFISMFCHMSKIDVQNGQVLARGAVVGRVGSTGRATGPHMHWNVSLNDARVDPAIFIGAFQP